MRGVKPFTTPILCLAACFIAGCGSHDSGTRNTSSAAKRDDDKVLNLYNWADYKRIGVTDAWTISPLYPSEMQISPLAVASISPDVSTVRT